MLIIQYASGEALQVPVYQYMCVAEEQQSLPVPLGPSLGGGHVVGQCAEPAPYFETIDRTKITMILEGVHKHMLLD